MDKLEFGKRLIQLRKVKGFTQQELADKLNVTNKAISRWETGEGFPDIILLKPLSNALSVSCDELLGERKNYKDIERADMQRYAPYVISTIGLFLFYLFSFIKVPLILSFFVFMATIVFSYYVMIHHTNKEDASTLTYFHVLLILLPFITLLESIGNIFVVWMSMLAVEASYSDIVSLYGSIDAPEFINTFGLLDAFMSVTVVSYVLGGIGIGLSYINIKRYLIDKYGIMWKPIRKHTHPKREEDDTNHESSQKE